jgi:hypothetical protein
VCSSDLLTIELPCRFVFALNHEMHTRVVLADNVTMVVEYPTGAMPPVTRRCLAEDMHPLPGFRLTYGAPECFTGLYVRDLYEPNSFVRSLFE